MAPGGHIVAITPRSFCNGPYYKPFRTFMLSRTAIRHLHLFKARDRAFRDDNVLQENVIVLLERAAKQGSVVVSTSTDDQFSDYTQHEHPFSQIVAPDDPDLFIHVPTSPVPDPLESSPNITYSLEDIGVEVSTGPVVDFRLKQYLRTTPIAGTVPLLYPIHFSRVVEWPKSGIKKPNAILYTKETQKWLYPKGFYAVVRRFSSKEEKRRIVPSLVEPGIFDADWLGFENHLNVFHFEKQGLPEYLARGLVAYLSTSYVDQRFRRFSGHTQVNATDLRSMKYPHRDILIQLGKWIASHPLTTENDINFKVNALKTGKMRNPRKLLKRKGAQRDSNPCPLAPEDMRHLACVKQDTLSRPFPVS
jgi:hypothetical protein